MGAPGVGVGNGSGKAARRLTVFVGVTCGEVKEAMSAVGVGPFDCKAVMLAPLSAPPPIAVGS